jgi:hypothetical protein
MRHTDTSSFLQEKKSRRRGVRFSGGDQSRLGRRDPIQPLRNPIKYKPPGLRFPFCSQNPSRLSVPLQPRPAPHREFAEGRATTPRHATQRNRPPPRGTASIRPSPVSSPPPPSASTCPRFFFLPPTLDWD